MRLTLLLLLTLPLAAADFAHAPDADLLAWYGQLRTVALDPERSAVAENLVLAKDAATFRLTSGTLYFFQAVGDRVAGAVFLGEGSLALQPPAGPERQYLARELKGATQLDEPFSEAVLLFSDGTFEELARQVKFRSASVPSKAADLLSDLRHTFRDDLNLNVEARLLAGLCFPAHGVFLADIHGSRHGRLLFLDDPQQDEDIELIHLGRNLRELWSAFRPGGASTAEHPDFLRVSRTSIDTTVEKNRKLAGESVTEFQALVAGPRLLSLRLAPTLRVTKAAWGDGKTELKFIQEDKKKDADLWVILPAPLEQGQSATLRFSYAGDDVIHSAGDGNFYVGARTSWFPHLDNPSHPLAERALYHLTFHAPKEFTLVASGKLLGHRQEGKIAVTEWDSEFPFDVAGFNYGRYRTTSTTDGGVEITVYANPGLGDEMTALRNQLEQLSPEQVAQTGITAGGLNTTKMAGRMLAETVNAVRLYSVYYGPLPSHSLSITQQPAGYFGQSWPTLVFMPYTALLDGTMRNQLGLDRGGMRQFLEEVGSHEVAHQWWGHLVGWKSYHDQWLSEGFAQYSAALYAQRVQGEKKFLDFLENQRDDILKPSSGGSPPANGAGPIWMGYRLFSEKYRNGSRLIYSKGAYVLHMLRMMLYDFRSHNDDRFIAMMRDFTSTYRHRNASTEDFKAIVDKHFQQDMGWFFNQWVYGTDVPAIRVEYSLADNEKGALLKGVIHQEGVSPDFRIALPVLLRAGNGLMAGFFGAKGPETPFQAQLPKRPDKVDFNPLDAVLCTLDVKQL